VKLNVKILTWGINLKKVLVRLRLKWLSFL